MNVLLLLVVFSGGFEVFQLVEGTRHCRRNEVYVKCVNRCNNCVNRGHCSQITVCDPGCDCKRGYYRNREGLCVPEKECDEPGNLPCRDDEEYRECSCVKSCCNRGDPEACSKQCLSGCFCREGLVRDQFGDCINLEDCQTTETPSNCTADEQFYKNKPDCKNTCENYDNAAVLCIIGKPGCFCKDGLVKRKDGKCVKPEKCFEGKCRKDEQYYKYKPDCKNTCERYNNPGIRCARGNPGCFCKLGLVKRKDGKCVKPEECSGDNCREDEQYYKNKPDCKNTCQNYNNPGIRCASGEPGCFCKEGLVKRKDGKCVTPEKCPGANRCLKRGEVFMKCGPSCGDETCLPYRIGIRCLKKCKPGCFCRKGLVRDSKGNCVKRSECDNKICGTNEEHKTCGTNCQPTCDNQNPICTKQCKDGCFCKTGFIREKKGGKCIPVEQCPTDVPEKCGKNEEYKTCGGCQGTCDIPDPFCTKECKRGCYCKKGYIREEEGGKCIPVSKCPNEKCGKNEMYLTCGGCQGTCDDRNPECTTEVCRKGCYCKAGYVRVKKDGRCIPVDKCPKGRCPYGEEYLECGSRCPATCDSYGEQRICTADCVAGCFCKKGMVRNKEGKCVVPEMCGKEVCYRDEQFENCGTACPDTCDNYGRPRICTLQCVQGCFCKTGLVRRDDFRCVLPERCNKKKCNKDEVYKKCGTACPETCDNHGKRRRCTKNCVSGCFCRNGLVRDLFTKKCIPPEQCGKDLCGANEEFQKCGTACPPTCFNRKPVCSEKCEEGCFCKKGFIREKERGICIAEKKCPKDVPLKCGKYEEYKTCGGCQATCANRNPFCTKECKVGCYCKKGYIREEEEGKCIPVKKCPKEDRPCPKVACIARAGCYLDRNAKPCPKCVCPGEPGGPSDGCGKNEEYKSCGSCQPTCNNRNPICTLQCRQGCYCKSGFIRESSKGNCIPIRKCPRGNSCPKIECNRKEGCYLDRKAKPCPKCVCPIEPGDKCGKYEEHKTCGTACQPTCDNKNPICTDECVDGCFCKDGYIREKEGGRCIPTNSCPSVKCNADEEYTDCGSLCPATCSNYGETRICATLCVPGCFCRKGTVRHSDGRCVIPERCNNEVCYDKEEYLSCGSSCPDTCDNYGKDRICTYDCVPGCFCKQGLVRDELFRCIIPEKCDKEECNADEVKKTCGSACPETCENYGKPRICTEECVTGCFCKDGLVRDTYSKKCIPPEECKKRPICGVNEEIVDCAKPKWCNTCGIRGNCKLSNCSEGCDCKAGFYRDENEVCIPDSKCPSTSTCGVNEETVDCAKPKWCNTCKIRGNCKLSSCSKGCDCKKGFYRDDDGVCIPKSKCPSSRPCPKINCNRRKGCYLNRNAKPCPKCVCPSSPGGPQCSLPKCKKGCRIDYSTKPCPSCKCDGFPGGPQCSPPKCAKGCRIDYSTKPCPSCKCDEFPGGPQCSPPKCDKGCRIDYRTKPCPSCKCDEFPGGPQCSPPKCGKGCRIDYSTKPCPSCKCDGIPGGPQCSLPKCEEGCKIDYSTKPCPSCKCDEFPGGPQCSLPKCEEGCRIDYSTKPCPSCKCDVFPGGPQCDIPRCDDGCRIDYSTKPCPSCKCDTLPGGPQCDIPRCDDGCTIDYSTKPCPSCKCDTLPGGPQCDIPQCDDGCTIDYSTKPCPSCKCDTLPGGPECSIPKCDENCTIDYNTKPCPSCKCEPEPPAEVCGEDEELVECVPCANTCETYEQRLYCKPACRPGCTCKEGLVKRKDGKCVLPEQCDKRSEPPKCGKDEEYYDCIPSCKGYCETYNKKIACKMACKAGCFCKKGLVKRKDGKCVKPKQCFSEVCGRNEVYSTCVNPCNDCQTRGKCNFLVCNEGCDCRKKFHRNAQGKCVPAWKCPKDKCRPDEEYYECKPSCTNRCNPPDACAQVCIPGCFCREGLVLRDDGKCVKKDQCEAVEPACEKDEQYYDCKPDCENTCKAYGKNVPCPKICSPGCFCKEGLVKREDGKCVKPEQCNNEQCRPDEEYYECKPSCTNVCDPPDACAQVCIPGCFCRQGLVLREDGKCVKKDQCEQTQPTCKEDEQYYDCKPDCQNTCKAYGKNVPCPLICSPGCFCKEGLVKREDGKCVEPEQCDNQQCKPDEEYYRCKPFCVNRCNPLKICPRICISGCFCRKGLVQRDDGKCVKKTECEAKPLCEKDEQYYDCIPDCTNTCETYGRPDIACPAICKQGCFCKEGLVKRKDGKCVRPNDCGKIEPPTEVCGKDEEYVECVPCGNKCENYEIRPVCRPICKPGCTCKGDLVKRKDGKCVPTTECEARECPLIKCPGDCYYDRFHKPCPRCLCDNKPGDNPADGDNGDDDDDGGDEDNGGSDNSDEDDDDYNDESDTEVEGGNGNTVCRRNEVYSTCVIPCNNCEEKGGCEFIACHKGCDCKKGYYRNKKGRCIPESKCPKPSKTVCGRNEVYSTCVNPCNNCDIKGNCQFLVCNKGCDCKPGYYRNEQNKCIPEYKCPITNSCPQLLCARGCHLDNTAKPCPRCVCPENPNDGGYETGDGYSDDSFTEYTYEETVDEHSEYDSYTKEKRSVDYTETNETGGYEQSRNTGNTDENCDTESGDGGSGSVGTKESGSSTYEAYEKSHSRSETSDNTYVEEYQESFSGSENGEDTHAEEYQESFSESETGEDTYIEEFQESHSEWEKGENTSIEEERSEEDSQSVD